MKRWNIVGATVMVLLVLGYLFWSTIITTGIVIWTKFVVEDVEVNVVGTQLPVNESLPETYYHHDKVYFKLPFDNIDQRDNGELSTSFISGEKVFAILNRDYSSYDIELICEQYANKSVCESYISETEDTLNFHNDFESYIKLIQISKSDLSIFDSRSEKMIESIRLVLKNVVVSNDLRNAKSFESDIVDGVIFQNEDRLISEIFVAVGGYTLVTNGVSEEELLGIIKSLRVGDSDLGTANSGSNVVH